MRRNCNLELRLLPPSVSAQGDLMEEESREAQAQDGHQKLTIFYDGKICVCDVTEFQARSILFLASQETEERLKNPKNPYGSSAPQTPIGTVRSPHHQLAGASMKRSLQRFLEKRRNRIQASSPYH